MKPVYFSCSSMLSGDEPLGYVNKHDDAVNKLKKEISTMHGYSMPPPEFIKVDEYMNAFVGVWKERKYNADDQIEYTGTTF